MKRLDWLMKDREKLKEIVESWCYKGIEEWLSQEAEL